MLQSSFNTVKFRKWAPPKYKLPKLISPSKNKPLKKGAFEKYKPQDLFSEFYDSFASFSNGRAIVILQY